MEPYPDLSFFGQQNIFFSQLTQYTLQIYSFMIPYSHLQISFLREVLEDFPFLAHWPFKANELIAS